MMKITVIALGKLKEKYFASACDEYAKRLSRYCDLKTFEISPEPLPELPSSEKVETALLKEADKIKKQIPKDSTVIALCVEGKRMSSEDFSKVISSAEKSGKRLCFIIGSSYGLHSSVKENADIKLSLSDMTFPHRLFRVMLLEQLYRGFKIDEGSSYHK